MSPWRVGVAAAAVLAAGCSSGGGAALTAREIHRRIEVICADEIDIRLEDGAAAEPGAFLDAGTQGDAEAAIDAAAYNVEALDRLADEVAKLDADDGADREALAGAVEGLEARRATWEDRHERLSSGGVVLEGDEALVDLVNEGAATGSGWSESLDHFGVDEPDCTAAVP